MANQFLLDDRAGSVYEVPIASAKWTTKRIGAPGKLTFSLLRGSGLEPKNGNVVQLSIDGEKLFYGFIFSVEPGRDEYSVTAYDQMRYMQFKDSYVFEDKTASDIIALIAKDFNLTLGDLQSTGHAMDLVCDNKTLLDMAYEALDQTLIHTKRLFTFYDDAGRLCLKNIESMRTTLLLGDESLVYDYKYKRSIDEDTYNQVKLVQKDKKEAKRGVYIAKDSANIAKWGLLQLYEVVEESLSDAKVRERVNRLIELKNRETQSLKLECLGAPEVRGGSGIYCSISELDMKTWMLVDEVTHSFVGDREHTMSVTMRMVG